MESLPKSLGKEMNNSENLGYFKRNAIIENANDLCDILIEMLSCHKTELINKRRWWQRIPKTLHYINYRSHVIEIRKLINELK